MTECKKDQAIEINGKKKQVENMVVLEYTGFTEAIKKYKKVISSKYELGMIANRVYQEESFMKGLMGQGFAFNEYKEAEKGAEWC